MNSIWLPVLIGLCFFGVGMMYLVMGILSWRSPPYYGRWVDVVGGCIVPPVCWFAGAAIV